MSLTRLDADKRRVVVDVDVSGASGAQLVGNGAYCVSRLRPTSVQCDPHRSCLQPGWSPFGTACGYRSHRSIDDLKPNADTHYVLIPRAAARSAHGGALGGSRRGTACSGTAADVELMPRDRLTVFDLESGREAVIEPLLADLKLQANAALRPKRCPTAPSRSGQLSARAGHARGRPRPRRWWPRRFRIRYERRADPLPRRRQCPPDRDDQCRSRAALRGDAAANLSLQAFDILVIKETPEWREQEVVRIEGEVQFPGDYPIRRGESLRSVLERAGGLTPFASARAAVFTRDSLRKREQLQMDKLAERVQIDLATSALQSAHMNQAGANTALSVGQSLLTQLRSAQAVGRLVIDLPAAISARPGTSDDVILQDGDRLIVPKQRQEVSVLGEVHNSTSHFYQPDLARDDYISLSGGATRKADRRGINVVRADGSVVARASNRWFSRGSQIKMEPGDTVVVPLDTERLPPLPLWQAVTQILYNVAVSVAAINSF